MRVRHLLGFLAILFAGASVPQSRLGAQNKKVKPFLGTCGTLQNPCEPNIDFMANTFSAATVPVETGPYRFTITVMNSGNADGNFRASCGTAPQISCTASPSIFQLVQGAQIVDTIIWSATSLGRLPMLVRYSATPSTGDGHPVSLTFTGNSITITGAPIATVTYPPNDGVLNPGDTIQGVFSHPSGVDSTTYKIFVDGHDSTASAHTHRTGSTLWANLTLLGGSHSIKTWGCAKNSPVRCDTSVVVVAAEAAPPTLWQLDDSLAPNTDARFGWVPGGVPLPPTNLLGCPVTLGDPTINVTDPASYEGQLNGNVFVAPIIWDDSIHINAVTHARLPNDTANVCSHQTTFPFLQDSLFDWTFWPHSDPHDTLWYSYPYHDRTPAAIAQTIGAPPQGGGFANSMAVVPGHGTAPGTQPPGSGLLLLPQSGVTSMPVVRPFLQNGGGIDTNSYNVTLNGDTIIKHGKPVAGKGVVEQGLATATSLYSMSTGHTNVNIYDPVRPDTSHNGGWNELIASIADTLGHRTSIRSRFVVVKSPTPVASFRPQALRNLSHLDQSDCAAFGAFQCGGTILSQTIPGFVTRDRDRSLHLVYRSASQKAPVILPFGISISRLQLAPDSFLVSAHEGAVRLPDSLRYIGAGIPSGVSRAESLTALSQEATAYRVLGSDVPAAATTHAIRTITTVFHPLYAGVAVEDSVTQEVVQLYLTDTTTGRFGPGWALGELSRLVFGDMSQGAPAAIWLDGDGSYQIFRKVSGVWTAPPGLSVRLDTTTQTSSDSAKYTLALGSGAMVGFRSDGWQVWTQDLVGNRTTFTYAPSTTRLVKITDPTGVTDSLLYNAANASGQVSDIFMIGRNGGADTARVASFAYDTTRRLIKSTILRSGSGTVGVRGDTTRFGYVTATAYGALLDTIVDPRSTASVPILTTFQYDSLYALPIVEKRPPDRYGVDSISIRFPWRRAVPRVGYGRRNANGTLQIAERLVAVNQYVGTHIDYDNNATDFAMGWFGSPTYVRNIAPPPVFGGAFLIIGNGGDNVRRVTHDSLGRVTKIVQSPDSTTITDSVMYHYDALNRVDQISRRTAAYPAAAGALDTVSFKYDSVTLAGGAWCSRMDTTVDVMKKRTYVIYGGTGTGVKQCLPLMVIGLARDTTSFTYGSLLKGDSAGVRPISTTDPTHVTQTMQYDHNTWNSAISTRSADTAVSRAFYNPWGRPDSTVAPDGARTFYRYDLSGRVRDTKTGLGSSVPTTRTFFNHGGLPDSVKVYASGDNFAAGNDTTPLGSPTPQNTRYYYDRLGFVDSSFTPGGRHLHYLRDRLGNPIWEYPGNGTYIVRVYDWMGRVTAETQSQVDPSYSVDGLAFADATTKSVYQAQRFQVGLTLSGPVWHAFTYGNRGWLGELDDTVSHRSTAYDAAGGIISDQVHFTDGATVRRTYQYNKRGQRTLAVTSVFGVTVAEPADTTSYFYSDSSGRLDSLQMSGSNGYKVARAVWAYDRAGRDSVQRVAIGKSTSYLTWEDSTLSQYDAAGRLARWQNRTSGFTNAWYDFRSPAYDHADQLKSYAGTEPVAGGLTPTNFDASVSYTMSYATDGSRRLLVSTKSGGTPITHTYRYDTFGNRLSDFAGTGCAQLYTYGPDNQLLRRADSTSACANHRGVYWTDAVGNRLEEVDTADGQGPTAPQLMSYTARNQLFFSQTASVITGMYDFNWHYYDGKGLREESVVSNGQAYLPGSYTAPDSGQHSYYFYDGPNVALVLVRSGSTWWVRQRYLMGGVDGPLALRVATSSSSGSQNLIIITDRSGSTISAIDTTKQQLQNMWAISRDPYGKTDQAGAQSGNQINLETGFAGASSPNSGAGFVYLRNRWYDPTTGRFLTQDPIGLAGGVNLYAYAGNNPIAFSDPFGLCNKDKPHDCDDQNRAARIEGAGHQLGSGCPAISDTCNASALVPTSLQEAAGRVAEVTGAAAVGVALPAALTAAAGTSTSAATVAPLTGLTGAIAGAIQQAGPALEDRVNGVLDAVSAARLPGGGQLTTLLQGLGSNLVQISGGSGVNQRLVTLTPTTSTIQALDVAKDELLTLFHMVH